MLIRFILEYIILKIFKKNKNFKNELFLEIIIVIGIKKDIYPVLYYRYTIRFHIPKI